MRGVIAGLTLLLIPFSLQALDLQVDPGVPVRGEEVRLVVTDGDAPVSGAAIRATYRPNSEVAEEVGLGATDAAGRLTWRPESAGLVTLDVVGQDAAVSHTVSVKFPGLPWSGIFIFLLAGVILLGGSGVLIARALRSPAM
ncbi:MAG: hypothetical protein GF355_01945 [Candidatus Eisenbacteria bacterium]|nr:hypothetical protein [Candidatus Eisenbacteria bacterium]